jgi:hypothetical protein
MIETISSKKEIEIENYNKESLFPKNGIYLGELEDLLNEKTSALLFLQNINGLCFLTTPENKNKMHIAMQNIVLRILLEVQTGLVKIKMYDPTGLGDNLIYLAGLSSKIKGENILSKPGELKTLLENSLTDIPDVIQKILGHKFRDKSLIEYNDLAGHDTRPFHFSMFADYPHSFNKETNNSFLKILQSGKRAGYFTFMSLDTSYQAKNTFDIKPLEILNKIPCIYEMEDSFYIKGIQEEDIYNKKFKFHLHTKPPENLTEIIDHINDQSKEVKKVIVNILDKFTERNFWKKDSAKGIDTPIGKINFTDLKNFVLSIEDGETDNPHHCLIGGSTGSGKTVLLHNLICNTAWLYSPEQVQFYLLDYKEGTEFKVYENLPHVKVLSVKSEREFGVSVLDKIGQEMKKRGDLFKEYNVTNLAKYKSKTGKELPRILVIIDEFQVLLDGATNISSAVSKSLEDIGRRGRSFGVNLILSTQSLSGINITNVKSHLGLRITLRLGAENDCNQLLGFGNLLPFSFTKKGEAVYNSRSGLVEGNSRFQVAFIPDDKMDSLINEIRITSDEMYNGLPFKQFIYDGSLQPSIINNPNYENSKIHNQVNTIYLGEPVTLEEEHIYYKFRKQNESNVLMIGQDIESAISIFKHSFYQLQKQSSEESQFYIFNKLNVDNEFYSSLSGNKNIIHQTTDKQINESIDKVHQELIQRLDGADTSNRIVLGLFDINSFRNLRKDGFKNSVATDKLLAILQDGSSFNIHCIIYSYSYQGFEGTLTMKARNEFDTKIALKGGDSYKVFGTGNKEESDNGIALLQSPFKDGIIKLKVYGI